MPRSFAKPYHASQIVTCDNKGRRELFFTARAAPITFSHEIFHQLDSRTKSRIQKFKSLFPDDYLKLLSLKLHGRRDNLQFVGHCRHLIGLNPPRRNAKPRKTQRCTDGRRHALPRRQCPRIDYPLTKGEATAALNWCKTSGHCVEFSYRR